MDYERFARDVRATTAAKKALYKFAAGQKDGSRLCPRCGRLSMKEKLHTNALSRHAHVYVCDECGTDEAVREFAGNDLPLMEWAVAKMD